MLIRELGMTVPGSARPRTDRWGHCPQRRGARLTLSPGSLWAPTAGRRPQVCCSGRWGDVGRCAHEGGAHPEHPHSGAASLPIAGSSHVRLSDMEAPAVPGPQPQAHSISPLGLVAGGGGRAAAAMVLFTPHQGRTGGRLCARRLLASWACSRPLTGSHQQVTPTISQ